MTSKADDLKQTQLRLRQIINEKATANILIGLFAKAPAPSSAESNAEKAEALSSDTSSNPAVEALLQRPIDDIPDSSKIPELPALILPGQHASKKMKGAGSGGPQQDGDDDNLDAATATATIDDGIDYELLGKDRSKCSQAELDKIRRERNRMHAKRTRDRKRLYTEKMSQLCRQLSDENTLLRAHLSSIDPDHEELKQHAELQTANAAASTADAADSKASSRSISPHHHQATTVVSHAASPELTAALASHPPAQLLEAAASSSSMKKPTTNTAASSQILTLLEAANTCDESLGSGYLLPSNNKRPCPSVSSDDNSQTSSSKCHSPIANKRNSRRQSPSKVLVPV